MIRECLQACTLTIGQGSILSPMVNMGTAAARTSYCICRLLRIQSFINLTDFRAANIQFEVFRQVSSECILARSNMLETFNHSGRLFGHFIVVCISGNRRLFNCCSTANVYICVRGCAGNFEFIGQIFSNSDNNHTMPCLRHTIFLKFIKVGINAIASLSHIVQNNLERISFVCTSKAAYVLSKEPCGFMTHQDFYAIRIERAKLSVKAFLLTNDRKIVARKTECQCIDRGQIFQIKFTYISANHAIWLSRTNVMPICSTSIAVIVIGPSMYNLIITKANVRSRCAIC